jgi:hypothetical protein
VGVKENLRLVERLHEAIRNRQEDRYRDFYGSEAVARVAGVPRAMGGVLRGRKEIAENVRRHDAESYDVRLMFGDDSHVCVVAKFTDKLTGTPYLTGNNQPFTTYECIVYRIEGGRIQEQTTYANWLDAYVQSGLVDVGPLQRQPGH